jgi:hypothetical protein
MTKPRFAVAIALLGQTLIACGSSDPANPTPGDGSAPSGDTGAPPKLDGPGGDTPVVITPSGPGTVYGLVTDIGSGAGIAGVVVTGGGQSATTDGRGAFTLSGLAAGSVNLSASGEDYAPGFATAKVSDATQTALITLKKQGKEQSYSATTAKTLSEKTEAGPYAVILAPNSLDTTDTDLKVSITPLDPTKEREALPGSLVSGGATPSLLVPVTFAEFSILDSTGKRVNLKASASATVELPIPPALRSTYPLGAKIHCYAYDPATGKWEDFVEGTVQLSSVDGTSPVLAASIRHFSWYGGAPQGNNCVDVYVSVVSAVDGKPLPNARVEASPGTTAYTDANGSALVRSTFGGTGTRYTAYQTGIDVDGSLTGLKGAKYIEFGKVEEELVGLVQKPCTGDPGPTPGQASVRGSQAMPLVVKIGRVTGVLYEATAILTSAEDGKPGQVQVILEQGLPGPDGEIVDGMPASGAKITLTEGNGAPAMLAELAPGTGFYSIAAGVTITAGKSYRLAIDGDGNGSIDGTSSIFALGKVTWTNPTAGAVVSAANFTASWTDSGSALGGAAYAPLYYAVISGESGVTDGAVYIGTDRQFMPRSLVMPMAGLTPGAYKASITGFSGPFAATGSTTNNITGTGVTGIFYSASTMQGMISFTVQ